MWRFPYNSDKILREMESLAQSYLPQWRLDRDSPDIGSVIAMIFAGQMELSVREYGRIPKRCIDELIHMLGIKPDPPSPARTMLLLEADGVCKDGIRIAKGSRFFGYAEDMEAPIAFRTRHDLLAVYAELTCVLGISAAEKKVVAYMDKGNRVPIPLFNFSGENLYRETIVLKDSLLNGGLLSLERPFKDRELLAEDVRIRAWGRSIAPNLLYDGEQELPLEGAAVFGYEIFPYKECYIGQDEVFSKAGAGIECTFELEWGSFDSGLKKEKKAELKPVMRRPAKSDIEEKPHIFPQEVSLSYYNGTGFKKLHCGEGTGLLTSVFSGKKKCRIQFSCPEDMRPMTLGGYDLRCIRLQVTRADYCYLPGAVFYYPILKKVAFSYNYGKRGIRPETVLVHQGSSFRELTDAIGKERECRLFSDFPFSGENVMLGFDRVWGAGPVSMYLELENQGRNGAVEISYEYSTGDGFKPLHVTDGTQGLLRSGIVRFAMPADAEMSMIEDRCCFWIRMRYVGGGTLNRRGLILKGLKLNGVEAENRYVSEERQYRLEKAEPGLTARLFGNHILDAQVWVNEISTLSDAERETLQRERPQEVQAEYDIRGQATEFYVKWRESPDLENEGGDGRYYLLDRNAGLLTFGDGRHTKVPEETKGTAWKVKVTSCDGRDGNVGENTITEPALSYVFLNRAYNPFGAYGGSDGENDRELVRRGRNFLSTGQKIVSEADFVNEAEGFSKHIAQAVLLKEKAGPYRLIVLLKEYEKGGFAMLREALRAHLDDRFPLAFLGHSVKIQEPVFVRISVNVWVTAQAEDTFEAEDTLRKKLTEYFSLRVIRVGDMPGQRELEQVLYQASGGAVIQYFQAVLTYTDDTGEHETALEDVGPMPDAVCINGRHCVRLCKRGEDFLGWNL